MSDWRFCSSSPNRKMGSEVQIMLYIVKLKLSYSVWMETLL